MKYKFRKIRLNAQNIERLEQINSIIREYQADGYKLTLRQLYYQLVSREIIPNQQKEYSKLSTLLKEGRMGGVVDWDAIEDRLRVPESPSSWDHPSEILQSAINGYAKPRMKGQSAYIEVWVEKDALSGVLSRVTKEYHVPIMVNRGYSSVSAMYDAFHRFNDAFISGQAIRILYLGDHDPSGIDMIRDIEDRILEFFYGTYFDNDASFNDLSSRQYLEQHHDMDFKVIPLALTKDQINEYNPPPNPAKMKDPRAGDYVKKNGQISWEVDALRPDVLNNLLHKAILSLIDLDLYKSIIEEESLDKLKLENLKELL